MVDGLLVFMHLQDHIQVIGKIDGKWQMTAGK